MILRTPRPMWTPSHDREHEFSARRAAKYATFELAAVILIAWLVWR